MTEESFLQRYALRNLECHFAWELKRLRPPEEEIERLNSVTAANSVAIAIPLSGNESRNSLCASSPIQC